MCSKHVTASASPDDTRATFPDSLYGLHSAHCVNMFVVLNKKAPRNFV